MGDEDKDLHVFETLQFLMSSSDLIQYSWSGDAIASAQRGLSPMSKVGSNVSFLIAVRT